MGVCTMMDGIFVDLRVHRRQKQPCSLVICFELVVAVVVVAVIEWLVNSLVCLCA